MIQQQQVGMVREDTNVPHSYPKGKDHKLYGRNEKESPSVVFGGNVVVSTTKKTIRRVRRKRCQQPDEILGLETIQSALFLRFSIFFRVVCCL